MPDRLTKLESAINILRRCLGEKGVWADPTRYRDQCWTRDLGIAIAPLLLQLGEAAAVKRHLVNLSAQQRPNGQIPILFLDDEARWVREKEQKNRGRPSFMLKRYRDGELWNLTPGTRDSELVYLIAMQEYIEATGDVEFADTFWPHRLKALEHIERVVMRNGLVYGCDWRDTMHIELGDKPLLTNNSLMYHVYQLLGDRNRAIALQQAIWRNHARMSGHFSDYPGSTRFDPLGAAFAILFGVVPEGATCRQALIKAFRDVDTDYGVAIQCRHNPTSDEEREVIGQTNGVVVWPFVVGFTIMALRKLGEHGFASEQFDKMTAMAGFREWYDPANGHGYGAQEQLWSAALYARALLNQG